MGESRGKRFPTPRLYHMQILDGDIKSVCTNQHNWLPDFLVSPAAEIFPNGVDGKQSNTDWKRRQHGDLSFKALASPMLRSNPGMVALGKFLQSRPRFDAIPFPIENEEERKSATKAIADGKELFSFRVAGRLLIHDSQIRRWWADRLSRMRDGICSTAPAWRGQLSIRRGRSRSITRWSSPVFPCSPTTRLRSCRSDWGDRQRVCGWKHRRRWRVRSIG